MDGQLLRLPLDSLKASPTNPRKRFSEESLQELAQSIRTDGLLQPLVVRPLERKGKVVINYEVVCGERRFRACKIAEVPSVICIVRSMDDADVLRVQIIENMQREDVHPLEESAGFRMLLDRGLFDIQEIAGRVGKTVAYVKARLALSDLVKAPFEAFEDGLIHLGHAILIAPLSPEEQVWALEETIGRQDGFPRPKITRWQGQAISVSELRRSLQHRHREISQAPFSLQDATLHPEAGPCETCAFRSANSLFSDLGSDRCMRPACWTQKVQAHIERVRAESENLVLATDAWSTNQKGILTSGQFQDYRSPEEKSKDLVYESVIGWLTERAEDALGAAGGADATGVEVALATKTWDLTLEALRADADDEGNIEGLEVGEGWFDFYDVRFVPSEDGAVFEGDQEVVEPNPQRPADVRKALIVEGPRAGHVVEIQVRPSAQAQIDAPESEAERATEERRKQREAARLRRAEMIARKRIWDLTLAAIGECVQPFPFDDKIIGIVALKVALAETNSIADTADPVKHPGRGAAFPHLGISTTYRSSAQHEIRKSGVPQVAPIDAWKAMFVAATYDEIHVGEGAHNPPIALEAFASLFDDIDMGRIRSEAEWETLSKKAQAERLKAKEMEASEA